MRRGTEASRQRREGGMEREAELIEESHGSVPPPTPASIPQHSGNGASSFEYELLQALQAIRMGEISVRIGGEQVKLSGKIAAANHRMAQQLGRVGQDVGRAGNTRQRVKLGVANGSWGEMEDSINTLI